MTYYWIHHESGCCGTYEDERLAESFVNDSFVDINVPKELYDKVIAAGYENAEQTKVLLLKESDRIQLFEFAQKVKQEAEHLASLFQNPGICMSHNRNDLINTVNRLKTGCEYLEQASFTRAEWIN